MFERLKVYGLGWRARRKEARGDRAEVDGIFERAVITAASAGTAGSIAATVTTPIDVVKTRIMLAAAGKKEHGPSESLSKGLALEDELKARARAKKGGWAVGKEVWRTEGMRGLFRGGLLRASWTAIGSGLYLGCYEGGRHWLERRRGDKESFDA